LENLKNNSRLPGRLQRVAHLHNTNAARKCYASTAHWHSTGHDPRS
jgi:hypothetical protein